MSDLWLTAEEVQELTDKVRFTAQCRELAKLGIPFQPNAVGRPLVARARFVTEPTKPRARKGPNWDALNAEAA